MAPGTSADQTPGQLCCSGTRSGPALNDLVRRKAHRRRSWQSPLGELVGQLGLDQTLVPLPVCCRASLAAPRSAHELATRR